MPKITREQIAEYTLMNDDFMSAFFNGNIECTEYLVRSLTGNDNIIVKDVKTQYSVPNTNGGKAVRLDIYAVDETGKEIDIEIENSTKGLNPRRIRLYNGMLDSSYKDAGDYGEKLPDRYIIFVCDADPYELGYGIYEENLSFTAKGPGHASAENSANANFARLADDGVRYIVKDGITVIHFYIHGRQESTNLSNIAHDFQVRDSDDIITEAFKEPMRRMKKTEEGEQKVGEYGKACFDEGIVQGMAQGMAQGMTTGTINGRILGLYDLVRDGLLDEKVAAQRLNMTVSEFRTKVEELQKEPA